MPSAHPHSSDTGETEARILEAAHRVFVRRGTSGARMQEIADEAGVNKALLHYYFRSKERLAEVVILRVIRMLFPRMLETIASDLPLREKLDKAVGIELDILEENPYLPGYLLSEFQYQPDRLSVVLSKTINVRDVRRVLLGKLQSQLDEEAKAGRIRPTRAEDLVVGLIAQLVFPFVAAPMLQTVLGLDQEARREMITRRREGLADALMRSLQP